MEWKKRSVTGANERLHWLYLYFTNPIKESLLKTCIWWITALLFLNSCSSNADSSTVAAGLSADSLPLPGPSTEIKKLKAAIQAFTDSTFRPGSFNGSLLVARDGEIIYEKYAGFCRYRLRKDSISDSTAFHLASVSKTITAMTILKMVEEGKLKLEDSLVKFFPGFPRAAVTVESLLNHRSGLPNYVHYMDQLGWNKRRFVTNQDVLEFLIDRQKDIDIGPANRRFSYSNTNYALLALLIEKLSGSSYPEYIRKHIFEPLGMKHSYVFTSADSARSMPSYFFNGRQYAFDFLDKVYGDKNIYSTVQDLFRFDLALMNGKLIQPGLLAKAFTPYSFEKPGSHNYGLGWRMLLLKNGKKLVYHNGWWHGNRTALYHLPDEKVTIIALCNNDYKMIYSVRKLADLFGNYQQNGDSDDDSERSLVQQPASRPAASSTKPKKARAK